jgi:hypothetical protein
MKLTIDVTADDIEHGKRRDCNNCPVARAIQRHFHTVKVGVGAVIYWDTPWHDLYNVYCVPPDSVFEFISRFDNNPIDYERPQPISFELEIPEEVIPYVVRK